MEGPKVSPDRPFELHSCRQLFELYPASTSLRPAVEVIERTIQDEPGIAFTHCRGLLETVCVTILADRGKEIPPNPKPNWLMTQAIGTLQLTALNPDDKEAERGVTSILRGLNSLVDGVVALRNSQGVGPHGRDALEHVLSVDYAMLTATAVDAAVGLMFRLHQEQIGRDPINYLRFGVHADFDSFLDAKYSDIRDRRGSDQCESGASSSGSLGLSQEPCGVQKPIRSGDRGDSGRREHVGGLRWMN